MTDYYRVISLLNSLGVVWRRVELDEGYGIEIRQGDGPRNVGYTGFLTSLEFDDEGNFVAWGCWE